MIAGILLVGVLALAVILPHVERLSQERRGTLPRDHGQPVVYVALGDSTVVGVGASSPERNYSAGGNSASHQRRPARFRIRSTWMCFSSV